MLPSFIAPVMRDSIVRAREQQVDRTAVTLKFAANMGTAINHRQANPDSAVMAPVASADTMPLLSMPGDRARRALRLCVGNQRD